MPAFKQQNVVNFTQIDVSKATSTQKKLLESQNGFHAYDESVVASLEQYLDEQIKSNQVDIDANLALLKLYLVYPSHVKADTVAKILAKAIMVLPSSFFTGASTMIGEKLREDANVKSMLTAGSLLQSCHFEEIWKLELAFAKKIDGFVDAVRGFILDSIRKSHTSIGVSALKCKLNVSDAELKTAVKAENWTIESDVVKFAINEGNQMRPKKIQEQLQHEDLLKVIDTLSR